MRIRASRLWLSLAGVACALGAAAAAAATDDRLVFSADGESFSQGSGGAGGSVGWLHNFTSDTLAGAAVEYQTIANSHWTFGSLSGSTTSGPAGARLSLYAEAHEGAGDVGTHAFNYSIVAAGFIRTFGPHFSMQLEDREIDIDTTHGNLPKLGASVLWGPRLQTAVAWQHSVSGNLGTNLGSIRIDAYGKPLNWLVGGAFGQGAPAVVNLQTEIVQPGAGRLKEVFVGASKPLAHGEVTLVADYLQLSGIKRRTLTANYVMDLGAHGHAK